MSAVELDYGNTRIAVCTYNPTSFSKASQAIVVTDQRTSARKILKVRAVLAMEGQAPVQGRTSDVGINGVCMTVPHPLQTGQTGQAGFDLLVDGHPFALHARVKVMYCIFSNGEFKAGLQFMHLDLNSMSQLSRFLR